jgi:phospholipase/carboxylesterase
MNYSSNIDFKVFHRLFAAAFLLTAIFLNAQEVKSQAKQLAGYDYKEVVLNADPAAAGLPVVVGLHWSGSTPDEFEKYLTGFTKPVRIILVRAPYAHKSGFSFFSRQPKDYYKLPDDEKMAALLAEGEKLSRFVEELTARYRPKIKPVIIGASQGGDLSYVIGIRYNHLISLSCPLLATMDNRIIKPVEVKNAAPINVFHGTADPIVNIGLVEEHTRILKKNGFKTRLRKYKDIKHDIPDSMKADYVKLIDRVLSAVKN